MYTFESINTPEGIASIVSHVKEALSSAGIEAEVEVREYNNPNIRTRGVCISAPSAGFSAEVEFGDCPGVDYTAGNFRGDWEPEGDSKDAFRFFNWWHLTLAAAFYSAGLK